MVVFISPLPSNPYKAPIENKWCEAYDQCLQIQPPGFEEIGEDCVYARILGYLILETPTPEARNHVSQEILNCNGNIVKLHELAKFFMSDVLSLFNQDFSGPDEIYPKKVYKELTLPIKKEPKTHKSARRAALHRDNQRCMLSRSYDLEHYDFMLNRQQKAQIDKITSLDVVVTVAWNIIPALPTTRDGPHFLNRAWEFFLSFSSLSFEEVSAVTHSLANTMTVARAIAPLLSQFHVWLEPASVAGESTYEICSRIRPSQFNLPQYVTFTTETDLALPSPQYLKAHAAFCRVARLSGAAELRDYLEDQEIRDEIKRTFEDYKRGTNKEASGVKNVRKGKRKRETTAQEKMGRKRTKERQ